MLPVGERNSPGGDFKGTRVKLVAAVGADDVGSPGAVGVEPTGVVGPASGDAVGDVAWADADPEADELEFCALHPTMSTPATARAAPVSNVRRAVILVIF